MITICVENEVTFIPLCHISHPCKYLSLFFFLEYLINFNKVFKLSSYIWCINISSGANERTFTHTHSSRQLSASNRCCRHCCNRNNARNLINRKKATWMKHDYYLWYAHAEAKITDNNSNNNNSKYNNGNTNNIKY